MQKLKALHDAMATGLNRGALIHERTGSARPVEVVAAQDDRLLAVVRMDDGDLELLHPDAKVRIELPQDASVVYVPGRVTGLRPDHSTAEVELDVSQGAEQRQRRMDVRVDAECRVRLGDGGAFQETRTVDVSAGGVVVADLQARVGEVVDVELELDGAPIRVSAEVIRKGVKVHGTSSRTAAALRFYRLPDAVRERLSLFVLRRQALEKLRHRR